MSASSLCKSSRVLARQALNTSTKNRSYPFQTTALYSSQFQPLLSLSSLHSQSSSSSQLRSYSSTRPTLYNFDGGMGMSGGGDGTGINELSNWPITKTNTILNIVPQGKRYVVERFGKLSAIHDSGYFLAVPFVDQIAYVIDVRERAIDIVPQSAITRDNVSVEVSGNLFVQFIEPEKAAYGARNPLYSVMQVSYFYRVCTVLFDFTDYLSHM